MEMGLELGNGIWKKKLWLGNIIYTLPAPIPQNSKIKPTEEQTFLF